MLFHPRTVIHNGIYTTSNQPPSVDAGQNKTIAFPGPVNLDGSVVDDGLGIPDGRLDIMWIVSTGPGVVTFADAQAAETTATFSTAGDYVLNLTAFDGEYYVEDTVTITVNPAPEQYIWLPIQQKFTTNQ